MIVSRNAGKVQRENVEAHFCIGLEAQLQRMGNVGPLMVRNITQAKSRDDPRAGQRVGAALRILEEFMKEYRFLPAAWEALYKVTLVYFSKFFQLSVRLHIPAFFQSHWRAWPSLPFDNCSCCFPGLTELSHMAHLSWSVSATSSPQNQV